MASLPLSSPPGGINPRTLPSVLLGDRGTLPSIAAVYFAIGVDDQILYVDSTRNLNQKWIANQQYNQLATLPGVRIAWLEVEEPEELEGIKGAMIEYWEPVLNDWRYKLRQIQDLTIDGWSNFQKVTGEIWACYRDAVMPLPVPSDIFEKYRQAIRDAAEQFKKVFEQERLQRLEQLRAEVQQLERSGFVPPAGCYLSTYRVKRSSKIYEYWKLWSHHPVFPTKMNKAQEAYWLSQGKDYLKEGKVKSMHLGKTDNPVYSLATAGLQTRKRIEALQREIDVLLYSLSDAESL